MYENPSIVDPSQLPRTLKQAAELLNLPYHVVQRAAKSGLVPTYYLLGKRKYVKIADFMNRLSAKV